jgi:hypothetical protein
LLAICCLICAASSEDEELVDELTDVADEPDTALTMIITPVLI